MWLINWSKLTQSFGVCVRGILQILFFRSKNSFSGGKSESNANMAEGLATALVCFDDMNELREERYQVENYCILICNSTPYSMPVSECTTYEHKTIEQLAALFNEVIDDSIHFHGRLWQYFFLCFSEKYQFIDRFTDKNTDFDENLRKSWWRYGFANNEKLRK